MKQARNCGCRKEEKEEALRGNGGGRGNAGGGGLAGPMTRSRKRNGGGRGNAGGGGLAGPMTRSRRRRHEQLFEMRAVVVVKRLKFSVNLLDLPPELIGMILGYVNEPQDLINCTRTAPIMDKLLERRKSEFLFGKILPLIFNKLGFQDILKCRQVCRKWNKDVENFIERRPSREPYSDSLHLAQMRNPLHRVASGESPLTLFNPCVIIRATPNNFDVFTLTYNQLKFRGKNPFFGTSLEITLNIVELNWDVDAICRFFRKFGRHLRHLTLRFEGNEFVFLILACFYTRMCLHFVPNLKSLTVQYLGNDIDVEPAVVRNADENLQRLMEIMSVSLPQLHTLELKIPQGSPLSVTTCIGAPYLHQIARLELNCWHSQFPSQLPNLKDLTLTQIRSDLELEELLNLTAPLEKLSLVFQYRWPDVNSFNNVVSCFPLRILYLKWAPNLKPGLAKSSQVWVKGQKVPSIHTLHMAHSLDINYTFLQWFPNLRYLYLNEVLPTLQGAADAVLTPLTAPPSNKDLLKATAREVVQIHRQLYNRQMMYSNIWEILTKLGYIQFKRNRLVVEEQREIPEEYVVAWENRRN